MRPLPQSSLPFWVVALGSTFARAGKQDVVDTAVAAGQFKTLAAALNAAGLVKTLKGSGPFTVFAPTDEAFAKLPAGTVDDLLKPENKAKLTAILTYHVVPGAVTSQQVDETERSKDGERLDAEDQRARRSGDDQRR